MYPFPPSSAVVKTYLSKSNKVLYRSSMPENKRVQPKTPVELRQKLVEEVAPEMGDNPSTITRNIVYS